MPISLIRNTKDNAMHGTDNDRYTGCRMKMQGGTWFTREGELKDITDLTCERCKEVFATKMIRESNKEELRIAKEEKKRYQRAKKQGIVREATYEEYLMNRESEASAKRDSRDDAATSNSLHMLRDAIPASNTPTQPAFNSYNNTASNQFNQYSNNTPVVSAPQSPFDPYAQSQPAVSAPQAAFNPYAQPAVSAPQSPFDPYAQSQPAVSAPQSPFDPYAQTPVQSQPVVTAPQAPFDPYAYAQPQQNLFNPYEQSSVSQPFASQSGSVQLDSIETPAAPQVSAPVDDTPTPTFQEYTGAATMSSSSASSTASADDDFLSQFMINPSNTAAQEETPAPASSVSAESIVGATDDILSQFNIGSQLAEEPAPVQAAPSPAPAASRADASSFFNDSIPVIGAEYAGASSVNSVVTEFGSLNITEEPKDEFVVPNVPVYQPGGSTYVTPGSKYSSPTSAYIEELAAPVAQNTSVQSDSIGFMNSPVNSSEDLMSGFGEIPSVAPSAPAMSGFGEAPSPAPAAPSMSGFGEIPSVAPVSPSMNGFGEIPSAAPVQNNPYAQSQSFTQNMYQQPAANPYQNPYAAPVQQNQGFQQVPQGFVTPQAPVQPSVQPAPQQQAHTPVFGGEQNGTADSIEDALRQLGADVGNSAANNNQMPEKEEIIPDFVAYVPSSSKVLNTSPSSASASATVPKRPMSAREAKQLAKIDAKFKKDLISRGFNPNEIKNGRRGK